MFPGKMTVPRSEGGVKIPSDRTPASCARHHARDESLTAKTSDTENCVGPSGAGTVGRGCVGHASSPGTSLLGTARSETGKSGLPVSRSRTNTYPIFVVSMSAGMFLPFRRIVKSTGSAGMS